jgi:hypothetical protein
MTASLPGRPVPAPPVAALLGPETAAEDLKNALAVLVCFAEYPLMPVDNAAVRRRIESALRKIEGRLP